MAEKWTNTSASPFPRSMKPYPFSFENHLTVPSAKSNYSLLDDYKSASSPRSGANLRTESDRKRKLVATKLGTEDSVLQQAGDRHRADAAGNRGHVRRDVGNRGVDVAHDTGLGSVDPDV